MKKYYLFCNGSRGDCEPAICIAEYLKIKGNQVKIFANSKNDKLLQRSKIDYQIIFKNYINKQPEDVSPLTYYHEFKDNVIFHLNQINKIEDKPDAIFGMGDQLGKFLAEKFKVPYYHIVLQYYHVPIKAKINITYLEKAEEFLESTYRKFVSKHELAYFNIIRQDNNLNQISDFVDYIQNNENCIVANSLILSNFNYINHKEVFVSGNINQITPLDPSIENVEGLSRFMSDDTNYIYLNLGSMSQNLNTNLFKLYQDAFKDIDCKVIIGCNRENQSNNDKFFFCPSINQNELFKKIKIVIHCGGIGVAFKAAYHAVPQIIIPKNFEEPFWAKKILELGCGETISDFKYLSHTNLNKAINNILNNPLIFHNARMVSKSIDINGVENIFKKFLS
jgi:UDP:flavonoid glycosyltransferase YjiC (YdhE family)